MSWVATVILIMLSMLGLDSTRSWGETLAKTSLGKPSTKAPIYQLPSLNAKPIAIRHSQQNPSLKASSVYAMDADTGQPLYSSHADDPRAIASVTKMATALVILKNHSLDDVIAIPKLPNYKPEDEVIGLQAGQKFTVRDLLAALLIQSANDAADALAIADSGSTAAFASQMNHTVAEWGITGAHFSNPSGLVDANNSASARSLAQIGDLLIKSDTARKLINTSSASISDQSGHSYDLKATDELLQNGEFTGIKTGYTPAAGQCFVGLTTVAGHQVITVVLNSPNRFGETKALADWIGNTYTWQ